MKYHFRKTRSLSFAFAFPLLIVVATLLALPSSTALGDEPVDEGDVETVRFQETLELDPDYPSVQLRVYRSDTDTRRIWHVAVTSENQPETPICFSTFPLEAGEDYYDFQLQQAPADDGDQFILLEVTPKRGEGPLDPPVYQLAFHLNADTQRQIWSCNNIGRGQHTELDGGPNLAIEEIDGERQLTRYDIARSVSFCGLRSDEDDSLEVFDVASGRFLPGVQIDVSDEGAGSLEARSPDEPIVAPLVDEFYSWLTASSDIRGAPVGASVPRPRMLGTLDMSSAWIEGEEDLGIGEYVTAGISTAAHLQKLRIFPGHGESPEAFDAYARPTQLLIGLSDGYRYVVDIPDLSHEELIAKGGLLVELPEPVTTRCVSVMILDATPGRFATDEDTDRRRISHSVAIAEVTAYSSLDADTEAETARRIIAELSREPSPERRDRIANFGNLIPLPMLDAISSVLLEPDAQKRQRVVPLLGRVHHDEALPILAEHLLRIAPDDADYRQTKRALAAHQSESVPTLLGLLDKLEIDDRKYVDVVRSLGRVGTAQDMTPLVSNLGEGSDFLRRERIRAISRSGTESVPELIIFAYDHSDTEGGLDALTTLVRIGKQRFEDDPAEPDGAKTLLDIYHKSTSRAHRLRAIEAIGYFHSSEAVALLGEDILADDPDPLVRKFAAASLRTYPDPAALQALQSALHDPSPDVRIAAIRALSQREDAAEAIDAVIEYARVEQWPTGLHHAIYLLAASPDPDAQQAISEVINDDVTARTARTALRALRRNERALPLKEIESILAQDEAPQALILQLVHMLGLSEDAEATPILKAIADREYAALTARSDDDLRVLSTRSFLALGTSRSDEARRFLLDAIVDEDRPIDERSFALHGLGFFNDRALLEELHDLSAQLDPELRPRLRDTLKMIQNRLAVDEAEDELHRILDALDELDDDGIDDLDELPPTSPTSER